MNHNENAASHGGPTSKRNGADATTNADRIRAMRDEELAVIIMCPYDKGDSRDCEMICTQCCHDWLRQPAEEE